MRNEDRKNLVIVDDEKRGLARWAPSVVVFCVVGGFFLLSWYAYHAGIQSVRDEDLVVVEADKTPMKEKPADPGGMQFPNQDKTVFDTFSGNAQQPARVERVLPTPEEPLSKNIDNTETSTWINSKLTDKKRETASPEQVIGKDQQKTAGNNKTSRMQKPDFNTDRQVISPDDDESVTYVARKSKTTQLLDKAIKDDGKENISSDKAAAENEKNAPDAQPEAAAQQKAGLEKEKLEKEKQVKIDLENARKEAERLKAEEAKAAKEAEKQKAEQAKAEKAAADKEKAEEAKAAKEAAKQKAEQAKAEKAATSGKAKGAAGNVQVQLAAYESQEEADTSWPVLQKKYKELAGRDPIIIRADLGDKGIYYRLRLDGFASKDEARDLCKALTAKGQACVMTLVGK